MVSEIKAVGTLVAEAGTVPQCSKMLKMKREEKTVRVAETDEVK